MSVARLLFGCGRYEFVKVSNQMARTLLIFTGRLTQELVIRPKGEGTFFLFLIRNMDE
jgi:hypothetical protein